MDLTTRYLGLDLRSPLVASSSPLSQSLDGVRQLEDAGAAAIVLFSLFEEQLTLEPAQLRTMMATEDGGGAEARASFPEEGRLQMGPLGYLEHVRKAKAATGIPIIASLNGAPRRTWTHYAKLVEQAGADAIELNLYHVPTDPLTSSAEVEAAYFDTVRAVKESSRIPVAVKLHPFFGNLAWAAQQLHSAGADALVLFNRFYQPSIDIERRRVHHRLALSTHADLLMPLRWIAILRGQVGAQLAATGGIHDAEDVVQVLMAGADVAMLCSTLLQHGPDRVQTLERGLRIWLEAHEHRSVAEIRGVMSMERAVDPRAFERAQYMATLESWDPESADRFSPQRWQ